MYLVLLIASLALFLLLTAWYLRQDFASVFHPITFYLAFHGLVFVIRPLFAYALGYHRIYEVYGFLPSPETKAAVIVAANLGLAAFVAGAVAMGREPLAFRQDRAEIAHRARLLPPLLATIAMLAPIALSSLWAVGSQWQTMRLDSATGVTINTTSNGWFVEAQLMLVPLAVLFGWAFRFRWWALIPLVAFIAVRAGTGGRGPFVVAAAAMGLLWLFDRRRKWPSARVGAALLAVAALFYTIGQSRVASVDGTMFGEIAGPSQSGFIESMDFANLEFFEYIVEKVPAQTGTYGYFVDNLQLFTEPVPRRLWPGKPVGAPIMMFNLMEYGNPIGMTYSLPGYGWMQAGYLGVIAWCALWGAALGAIYARFAGGRQSSFAIALYFAFLPIFIVAFRDGGLVTIARTGVFYLTPILAWMLLVRMLGIPFSADRSAAAPASAGADMLPRSRRATAPEIVPRAWRNRAP